jgi:hypothetical protein
VTAALATLCAIKGSLMIDHNKIIVRIAKEQFSPLHIIQKGKSRLFLDDNSWYTTVIEFQPSSWSKGTQLNIGADFHFFPRDYFAFEFGDREKEFIEFTEVNKFVLELEKYCQYAIQRVIEIREAFITISSAHKVLTQKLDTSNTWNSYLLGVINGLANNDKESL